MGAYLLTIANALNGVVRLSIDTAPFIYLIENNPNYVAQMRAVIHLVTAQKITMFSSVMTLTEVMTMPLRQGNAPLANLYKSYLSDPMNQIELVVLDANIAEQAAELRAKYNLKTPDAIQVATAIESGCDAFLHNDTQLLRVTEINSLILQNLTL